MQQQLADLEARFEKQRHEAEAQDQRFMASIESLRSKLGEVRADLRSQGDLSAHLEGQGSMLAAQLGRIEAAIFQQLIPWPQVSLPPQPLPLQQLRPQAP